METRLGCSASLQPALEVWAMVQSCQPGLALLTCGKRDISYDLDLPVALYWSTPRQQAAAGGAAPVAPGHALNDQHAYLTFPADSVDSGGGRL